MFRPVRRCGAAGVLRCCNGRHTLNFRAVDPDPNIPIVPLDGASAKLALDRDTLFIRQPDFIQLYVDEPWFRRNASPKLVAHDLANGQSFIVAYPFPVKIFITPCGKRS